MLVALPGPARTWILRLERNLQRGAGGITTLLSLLVVYLLVFLPIATARTFLHRDRLEIRPPRIQGESQWRPVVSARGADLHHRPFSPERSALAARFGLAGFLRTFALLPVAVALVLLAADQTLWYAIDAAVPVRATYSYWTAARRDSPWFDDLLTEEHALRVEYKPYEICRLEDARGKYVNVSQGRRHTYRSPQTTPDAPAIYFFGGSTCFGNGSRDDFTLPSQVARVAQEQGIPISVSNFGMMGDMARQEVVRFSHLLQAGERPDVAVFYDGWNDVYWRGVMQLDHFAVEFLEDQVRRPYDLVAALRAHRGLELLGKLLRAPPTMDRLAPVGARYPNPDRRAEEALRGRNQAHDHAVRIGRAYGVEVLVFTQPSLYSKVRRRGEPLDTPAERDILAIFQRAHELDAPHAISLLDALDTLEGPVMLDPAHVNETGNRAIAEALFTHLEPRLQREAP